ncbi:MAG: glucose-6-phosphate dehydrogenase [Chromatiaceae bacterium]|nr:glucose-6-phosphate dehydrogenase [Chromatiaceae bacterium]MCP5314450.1 glucose-6-phosphate dehydrogenase [Chromatiaceae bacterium]
MIAHRKNPATDRPTLFVLLGATGDLARRLVVPALFELHRSGGLPRHFEVLGLGRDELRVQVLSERLKMGCEEFARSGRPTDEEWLEFSKCLHYQQANLAEPSAYADVAVLVGEISREFPEPPQCVYYLATPAAIFTPAATGLGAAGLVHDRDASRLVVEKPIGSDLASFRHIDEILRENLAESQLYRIDHYLGKETVQNILALRFANPIFEPIWDRRYIDHVTITVAETLGVEHRGGYYERAGALRDMIQNHLMQLLCLIAMEPPASFTADRLRDRKMDVMRALRAIPEQSVSDYAARGQYGPGWVEGVHVPGYREEVGVDPASGTETFAALKLFIDNWRWQDVPFYLRTGKRLAKTVSEVSIRFRPVPHQAYPYSAAEDHQPARLVLRLKPDEGMDLKLNVKVPGADFMLAPADMRFSYQQAFRTPVPAAYETLLYEVLAGDQTLFMRADQIDAAWTLLQPVLDVWRRHPAVDFPNYSAGSWGPESAEGLISRDGRSWLAPTLQEVSG